MEQSESPTITRRSVLKTAGAFSLISTVGVGTALADKPEGNGNSIDAFLNQPAAFKDPVIWDGSIEDKTGLSEVTVLNGAMTAINIPDLPLPMAPVAFAPQVIKVDAGTEVIWTWPEYPEPVPAIPHDVVARKIVKGEPLFDSGIRFPGGRAFPDGPVLPEFSYTFEEVGEYLYYCTPHGAPFAVESPFKKGKVNNEFGMRGAVIVTDE